MKRKRVFLSEGFYVLIVVILGLFSSSNCFAQIEMKVTGSHFQDFNSLPLTGIENTWVDNQTIPGWYWQCGTYGASTNYLSDDGTSNYIGKRCYGTTGDSDRAIGGLCSTTYSPYTYGIKLFNSSSETITNISVGYTGEQWKVGYDDLQEPITFRYMITKDAAATFTAGTWTDINALYFYSPKTSSSIIKTLNGNDPSNRQIITEFSIPGIVIPPGSYILLCWRDVANSGGDHGLAIDDVTVKWTVPVHGSGTSIVWTGAQSNDWFDYRNWSGAIVPSIDSDVEIAAVARGAVCNESISIKSLIIRNGGHLTIDSCKMITVSGNSTFEGTECLILKSPKRLLLNYANDHAATASFLCNGTISGSGSIKVERFISAYTSDTDGWHFISSPVSNSVINDQFLPDISEDFYEYFETDDSWLSQKQVSTNLNNFVNGNGYLVSYLTNRVRSFSGLPNNKDFSSQNHSFTGNRGWHLLGNPYPCGISWGGTEWAISGINLNAKLLNSGGTYSDLSIGDPIPAMNGFFIKATASVNTITIPKAARLHTIAKGWKSALVTPVKKIKLIISSNTNNTFAETKIMVNENSTAGYDLDYDSPYLSGMYGTPLFYSVLSNGRELSTNCVPEASSLSFNFEFTPGLATAYTLKAEISDDWVTTSTFVLEDKLKNLKHTLTNSSSIIFNSSPTDAPDRFKLSIDLITGLKNPNFADSLKVVVKDKIVCISVPDYIGDGLIKVYDLSGREVINQKLIKGSNYFTLPNTGFYLVHFLFEKGKTSRKIYIP